MTFHSIIGERLYALGYRSGESYTSLPQHQTNEMNETLLTLIILMQNNELDQIFWKDESTNGNCNL